MNSFGQIPQFLIGGWNLVHVPKADLPHSSLRIDHPNPWVTSPVGIGDYLENPHPLVGAILLPLA